MMNLCSIHEYIAETVKGRQQKNERILIYFRSTRIICRKVLGFFIFYPENKKEKEIIFANLQLLHYNVAI
jgi:hypothetical protein